MRWRPVTASWLSFQGAFQRVRTMGRKIRNLPLRVAFWILGAPPILLLWWTGVLLWYVLWIALLPIAFVVIVPWRIMRRGSRRAKAVP